MTGPRGRVCDTMTTHKADTVEATPAERVRAGRQEAAIEMYRSGMSLEAIGEHFGISRERIRQIIGRGAMPDYKEVKRRNYRKRADENRRQFTEADKKLARSMYEGGSGSRDIATALHCSTGRVAEVLDVDRVIRTRSTSRVVPDEAIFASLRCYADGKIGPTPSDYEERHVVGHDVGAATIYVRFETWDEACRLAGLEPPPMRRNGVRRTDYKTKDDIRPDLIDFIRQSGKRQPTTGEYVAWAREHGRTGMATTIRRFGSWRAAVHEALETIDQGEEDPLV